ncbi:unnamed protein product [Urochloa humidicola]
MAIPVARVHLAMAHAALPALLPTPPKWKMMPLLPTPPCALVILPVSPPDKPKAGRADAVERWDAHEAVKPAASPASSCERWDSNKKTATSSTTSSSSSPSRASSSGKKWGSNKRRPVTVTVSRASSAERWDAHKKPRPPQVGGIDDDGQSSTGSNDMELYMPPRAFYAGPGFLASPEPSMLPPIAIVAHGARRCVAARGAIRLR